MSYTDTSNGTSDQRAERVRETLNRSMVTYRKKIISISAELIALKSRTEREIAQAIRNGVALQPIACAAGLTVTKARSVGLASEALSHPDVTPESTVRTIRTLTRQVVQAYG